MEQWAQCRYLFKSDTVQNRKLISNKIDNSDYVVDDFFHIHQTTLIFQFSLSYFRGKENVQNHGLEY